MTPEETKAAEDYVKKTHGYSSTHPNTITESFLAGIAYARAHPSAEVLALLHVLEAVRSQMCWECDRDQLTMGMADLHTSVTEALSSWQKARGG